MNEINFQIEHHNTLPSTNSFLLHQAGQDTFHGKVVVAREQTKGKGRLARTWESHKENLAFSIGFCLSSQPQCIPYYPLYTTVCVYDVLSSYLTDNTNLSIKWPNDILWEKRKLMGTLSQVRTQKDKNYISIGVGINLKWAPPGMDAISMNELPLTKPIEKNCLQEILENIQSTYSQWNSFSCVQREWEKRAKFLGKRVQFGVTNKKNSTMQSGLALGLKENGALVVELDSGEKKELLTEDLSLRF